MPSLITHRSNNFDALRLAAALTVLITHAWPLTGRGGAPHFGGILLSHIAVFVFFSISGYLIATSWNSTRTVSGYLARRVARIFPAVVVVIFSTVLLIGPAMTTLSTSAYFTSPQTASYLSGLYLAPSYLLPGVFETNPTNAVNGSLWSLGPEFICYLIVLLVGLMTWRLVATRPVARSAVFLTIGAGLATIHWIGPEKALKDGAGAMVFFMVGAVAAQWRGRLPLWPAIPLLLVWILLGTWSADAGLVGAWLAVPYVSLAVGRRGTPVLRRAGRYGDFSYGIYLWGFPIQQIVWHYASTLPLVVDVLVVTILTGVVAIGSWWLVEKRAITAGRRLGGQYNKGDIGRSKPEYFTVDAQARR